MVHPSNTQVVQSQEATYAAPTAVNHTWTRNCPACSAWLQKTWPLDSWVCPCGWRSP
jgi:hypothetical protein